MESDARAVLWARIDDAKLRRVTAVRTGAPYAEIVRLRKQERKLHKEYTAKFGGPRRPRRAVLRSSIDQCTTLQDFVHWALAH